MYLYRRGLRSHVIKVNNTVVSCHSTHREWSHSGVLPERGVQVGTEEGTCLKVVTVRVGHGSGGVNEKGIARDVMCRESSERRLVRRDD